MHHCTAYACVQDVYESDIQVQAVHFFPNGHIISVLLYTTHFNPNFHSDRAQLGRWMFTYLIRLSEYLIHLVACKCMQFSTPTHPNLKKEAYIMLQ